MKTAAITVLIILVKILAGITPAVAANDTGGTGSSSSQTWINDHGPILVVCGIVFLLAVLIRSLLAAKTIGDIGTITCNRCHYQGALDRSTHINGATAKMFCPRCKSEDWSTSTTDDVDAKDAQ